MDHIGIDVHKRESQLCIRSERVVDIMPPMKGALSSTRAAGGDTPSILLPSLQGRRQSGWRVSRVAGV
jgi:hypothetical protein